MNKRQFAFFILINLISFCVYGQGKTTIATWKNNYQAAQVFTIDDGRASAFLGNNLSSECATANLYRHGLIGTFGPIVSVLKENPDRIDGMRFIIGMGSEQASHGWDHLNMREIYDYDTLYHEIADSKIWFDSAFGGMQRCDVFMYPYCRGTDESLEIADAAFPGVRNACGGSSAAFTAYPADNFKHFNTGIGGGSDYETWIEALEVAIRFNGVNITLDHEWATGDEWDEFDTLVSWIQQKQNEGILWNTTLRELMRYGRERAFVNIDLIRNEADLIQIHLHDTLADESFDYPLTLMTEVPDDWKYAKVMQGNKLLGIVPVEDNIVTYSAIPDQGLIKLEKATLPLLVTGIKANKENIWLITGRSWQLQEEVFPSGATNPSLTYSSNNPSVATVDDYGKISSHSAGTATITTTTVDGGFTASTYVTVADTKAVSETIVSIPPTLSLKIGETQQLEASISPSNASLQNLAWASDDYSIATVDDDGYITAHAEGTTRVLVSSWYKGERAYCDVTVGSATLIPVTGITIDSTTISLKNGSVGQLIANVVPANASIQDISWTTSDADIVVVDSYGLLHAISDGTVTITATSTDGNFEASCEVTVSTYSVKAEEIIVSPETLTMSPDTYEFVEASVEPYNADDKTYVWSSADDEIATVDEDGVIHAIANGTVKIFATSSDGNFTDSCEVRVDSQTDDGLLRETFKNLNASITANSNGTYIGDNGETWTYESTKLILDGINQHTAQVNNKNSLYTTLPRGLDELSFKIVNIPSSVRGSGNFEVFINDVSYGVFYNSVEHMVEEFTISDINAVGPVDIEFASSGFNDAWLDDVSWIENNVSTSFMLTVNNGTGSGEYISGDIVNIEADAPEDGEEFNEWTGDVSTVEDVYAASTNLEMPFSDVTITAVYKPFGTYLLTVNNGTGGGYYATETLVDITADDPAAGKAFDKWTGDVTNIADVNASSTNINMPGSNTEITAAYTDLLYTVSFIVTDGIDAIENATVYFNSTSGVTNSEGQIVFSDVLYGEGMDYSVIKSGYEAVSGSVDVMNNISENVEMTVSAGASAGESFNFLTAVASGSFSSGSYTGDNGEEWNYVTVARVENGINGVTAELRRNGNSYITSVLPNGLIELSFTVSSLPTHSSAGGSKIEVFINSVSQGVFWADEVLTPKTHVILDLNLSGDVTIEFRSVGFWDAWLDNISWIDENTETYTLTVNNGTGSGEYYEGVEVAITADAPEEGKLFSEWTGDIQYLDDAGSASATLTMPASAITLSATYEDEPPEEYLLTVNEGSGSGSYTEGTTVNISASTPPEGEEFDVWTGDVSYVDDVNAASTTINMPAVNVTVTATFQLIETIINEDVAEVLNVFPNPVVNTITFSNIESYSTISILSISGQVMDSFTNNAKELSYDVSSFKAGFYIVKMKNKEGVKSFSFVKL